MNKTITINKPVDLAQLDKEIRLKSSKVTGLSLDGGTILIVYGGDDLTENDIETSVADHVVSVKIDKKQVLKTKIDALGATPEIKEVLKELVDL